MKYLTILALSLFFGLTFGQPKQKAEVSKAILESIKKDVWVPFMEAYDQSDSATLKSIHAQDIVRVTLANNTIETGASYLENFGGFVENIKEKGGQLGIAFAILSTAINEEKNMAYQTGYYRLSSKRADDPNLVVRGYGHFSVGLKKMDGKWKIWLDADKRADITHEEFKAQEIIYALKK